MEAVLDLPPTKTPIKRLPIEKLAAVECVRLHNISWETYRQLYPKVKGLRKKGSNKSLIKL